MMTRHTQRPALAAAILLFAVGIAGPSTTVAADPAEVANYGCATTLSPATQAALYEQALTGYKPQSLPGGDKDAAYCMPIAIHVIRNSSGFGGISQAQLDQGLIDVNNHELFVNTGMSFYYLPTIDYIDSDTYYSIDSQAESDAVRGLNRVTNAINVYFAPEFPDACGRASFTPDAVQGIVLNNGCVGVASNPSTYPHELGHYFDLLHTHETANGAELVDGTNCATAGDLLCDTPADPLLTDVVTAGCVYFGTATDANGDSYSPDTSQLMSYAPKACRVNVTPEGEARALNALLTARTYLLNCPPVAVCGGPYLAECASHTTTPVQLDGTGSFDPEGESLTYLWTGAAFDDPTSPTPTGQFTLGTTEVTLTVSDGVGEASCSVDVTVEDTTPPSLTCPGDITVECSTTGGVPADELAAFLADFVVSDICDADPQVDDDAPDLFEGPCGMNGGVTTVTWTAEDASGNTSQCSAQVTVIDTTPPAFDVLELNRDVLWPPNHKMSEIMATIEVSDTCDGMPTVTLDGIFSNEPDNGPGDGNTVDDIQEAAYGTDDRSFLLRSERSGLGDGRVYTVVYSVTDCSGNAATDSLEVRVPHNQGMDAMAYSGFAVDGASLATLAEIVRVAIPSVPLDETLEGTKSGRPRTVQPLDVRTVLLDRIRLGNALRVLDPVVHEVRDIDHDGHPDLVVGFDAFAVRSLRTTVTEYGPLGIQFRTAVAGGDRIVKDIFALGPPLTEVDAAWDERRSEDDGQDELSASPNPFNPQTRIAFGLAREEHVRLRVFNLRGQVIRRLLDTSLAAGAHEITWNGDDDQGGHVASGFYLVRLERTDGVEMMKVMLLK